MKKTRKLLSIVLSLLVVMGSLPVVYTAAADAVNVAIGEEGTIENPTNPVSESGEYNQNEVNHLTAVHKSLNFTFYQTMDNQYFRFAQLVQMEKYCGTWNSLTVYINGYNFNGNDPKTVDFFSNRAGEFLWTAGTTDSGRTNFPNGFEAAGSIISCTDYSWSLDIIFKGMTADESGEMNIGYSHLLDYTVTTEEATNNYQTPITTNVKILDARQLVAEMEKAENILAYPDNYTDAYVSAVEAALKSIPENLKDFSVAYTQNQIDSYVQMFRDISKNSADYTEYNNVYRNLNSITNAKGAFTDDSFVVFKTELNKINDALPKNLDYTRQNEVDAATQALRNAYNLLVSTDLSSSNTGASYTTNGDDGDMSFTIDNTAFKFMQIKDNQVFEYNQMWTIKRDGGNTARKFGGMILQTSALGGACDNSTCRLNQIPAANNTQTFVDHLVSGCYDTINARNEVGVINENSTTFTAPEFLTWKEYTDASGTTLKDTTIIDTTGSYIGSLDSDRNYEYSNGETYYLQNTPKFIGNPAGTYGEISMNYVLRTGWSYTTGGIFGWLGTKHSSHIHINNTVQVTDARKLISAVAEANQTLANPGNHSEAYITALKAAVDSVPVELLRGVEYYTQAQVDKLYQDITTIPEQVADYSEFVEVFDMMQGVNANKYTEDSFNTFSDTIYTINQNLPKNLTVDQQSTIDSAVDALYDAYNNLVTKHLNDDVVFTQDDIAASLGNNPLEFSIATTKYNFMLTEDAQKITLGIDLSARKNRTDYNCYIREIGFSNTIPGAPATYCNSDDFCHALDHINAQNKQDTEDVLRAVTGVTPLTTDANGNVTANDAGIISEYTTWKNISGSALSSNGYLIDNVGVSTTESTAHAEMYFTGASGNQEANSGKYNGVYSLWFGWYYVQPFFGDEGPADELYRHVHIPVEVNITDARALNTLYGEIEDILNDKTDKTYTLESLVTLYNAFNKVPADMTNGEAFYTQEEVDAKYAELKAAFNTATEGADYSEFFEAYVKGQEIVNTNNKDSAGNSLYDDDAYEIFTQQFTDIVTNLDMNLTASEQDKVNEATNALENALEDLEATKHADYSEFNEALSEIIKISKEEQENPGTYTQSSLEAIQNAYNDALTLDKELPASEQGTVDAVTEALKAAAENKKYKADYSEFDDAYSQVEDIVNNPGKYTDTTVEAAEKALAEANKLNKDLEDTADNRVTIENTTNALKDVLNNAEKTADYSAFEEAYKKVQEIAENKDGKYTNATVEAAQNALAEADKLDKELPPESQSTIDEATNALQSVIDGAKEKANYDGLDEALEDAKEIVNAPEGTYAEESVKKAQDAIDAAEALDKDLEKNDENQQKIDDVIADLIDSVTNAKEKADYSDFNEALDKLDEILNAPEGTYTDKTIEEAQSAKDAADALDKDLPASEQGAVDSVTDIINGAVNGAEEKADYTEFDKVVEDLKDIVNNPDKYTEETVKNAQDALDEADGVDKDLSSDEQTTLDEITNNLKDVVDNAKEKADYTDYNNAKAEADSLVNDDGNGNPIYDEDAFNAYKEAVNNVDTALNKNLEKNEENQQKIDDSTAQLGNLKDALEEKKYYTVTFKDAEGNILGTSPYVNGDTFGNLDIPELPADTEDTAYVGWVYADGTLAKAEDVVNGDLDITVASEDKKLIAKDESGVTIDEVTSYVSGVEAGTTVKEVLSKFDNDELVIEIKTFEGVELESEDLVGTGSTITLKSKYTGVIYETRMFIIMGDVDGDGDVDTDDYETSKLVGHNVYEYPEEHNYFFVANDIDENGFINAIDAFYIGRMRNA